MCYCDIFTVSLKYFYLRHFKLDFFTLHYKGRRAPTLRSAGNTTRFTCIVLRVQVEPSRSARAGKGHGRQVHRVESRPDEPSIPEHVARHPLPGRHRARRQHVGLSHTPLCRRGYNVLEAWCGIAIHGGRCVRISVSFRDCARLNDCYCTTSLVGCVAWQKKGKERKRIYIAPLIYYVYLKALRHGSHSFTCKYTMPAFPSYGKNAGL